MTPAAMLAALKKDRPKDGPRFCVVHAAYDLPGGEAWFGGDVDNRALLNARVNSGSLNQSNGFLAEAYHLRPRDRYIRGLVVRRLRHQVDVELLEGEFGSGGYAGHNRGWVQAMFLVAQRVGDREVLELALRVMAAVVAIEDYLEAPADAHRTLRGKSFMPGSRCGDRRGASEARDACREMETTGKQARKMPPQDATTIEVWMVRNAVVDGLLPKIEPGPLVNARWPLVIRKYEHGMEAFFPNGMPRFANGRPSAIGPLYGVSVDYRKPLLLDGVRGGAVEWVAWDEFAEKYKGSRPEGWNYPGGPLPRRLPERDLGRQLSSVTLSGPGSPPEPPKKPPTKEPPVPPKPSNTPTRYEIVAARNITTGQRNVTLIVEPNSAGELVLVRQNPPEPDA